MPEKAEILPLLSGPEDLKRLGPRALDALAGEIRDAIVSAVARSGGHLASNLGVVELSIALHRVFSSPRDKIVWDVGHQCYAHKLLTGRAERFGELRQAEGLSGFPKRDESPHDAFNTGHASTSISAALGMLAAKGALGEGGKAIAVIGDGALTGGLAYEALSHAGHLGLPLIVVLNDNAMSISPNVGGISKYLSRLSMKSGYQKFRRYFDAAAQKIPIIGGAFFDYVVRLKRAVKAVFYIDNFFVDLGFEYVGPIDGHNLRLLERVLKDARQLGRPVVVHAITRKGKGYGFAENDPGGYHGVGAFSVSGGLDAAPDEKAPTTFTDAFSTAIVRAAERDGRVAALTAAMEKGAGLSPFRAAWPGRFYDVGIAEAHAVTFAAGLAAGGMRPVVAIYSTFIQRAVDQAIHDVALQNLPVVFALDRAGFVDGDGDTHQGLFDLALFRPIPNMTILSPAGEGELRMVLDHALALEGPAAIRYPKGRCPQEAPEMSLPLETGRGLWLRRKPESRVCLAFTGGLYPQAIEAADRLRLEGLEIDLYSLRFLKPVDEDYLEGVLNSYDAMVFAEEGIAPGGFGEYACSLALRLGCRARVGVLAAREDFAERERSLGTRAQLLRKAGLDGEGIARGILDIARKARR